jgi:hypothetical protein
MVDVINNGKNPHKSPLMFILFIGKHKCKFIYGLSKTRNTKLNGIPQKNEKISNPSKP